MKNEIFAFTMTEGKSEGLNGFISLILPEGILEYFSFTHCTYTDKSMCIHLEEKDIIPDDFKLEVHKSVGFHTARQLKDFPIRGKVVTLSIKRRRWLVTFKDGTERKVSRDWLIIQQGTNVTRDFAAFLKAISR
jgi:hypothetical protein